MLRYYNRLTYEKNMYGRLCESLITNSFDMKFTFKKRYERLKERLSYTPSVHNDPRVQIWNSDRFGFKIVDPDRLNYVIERFNADLAKANSPIIHFSMFEKDSVSFIRFFIEKHEAVYSQSCSSHSPLITISNNRNGFTYTYEFRNLKHIIDHANEYIIYLDECKTATEVDIQLENNFTFFDDFYTLTKPCYNDLKLIIYQNSVKLTNLNINTHKALVSKASINKINLVGFNGMKTAQDIANEIDRMSKDPDVSVEQYASKILQYYTYGEDFGKKTITILKNQKPLKKVTNHNAQPFCLLTKDFYNDEEVRAFLTKWNLADNDRRIHNIIFYNFKTQNTRKNNTQIKIKSLTKLLKSDIEVRFFDKN